MTKVKIQTTRERLIGGKMRKEHFTMITGQTASGITANDIEKAIKRGELQAITVGKEDEPEDTGDENPDDGEGIDENKRPETPESEKKKKTAKDKDK